MKRLIFFIIIFNVQYYCLFAQNDIWKIFSNEDIGIQSSAILCIAEDKKYNIWIGTNAGGVFEFDWNTWTNFIQSNSKLPANYITSIAVDSNNVKWIGTLGNSGGLTRFDDNTWRMYNLADYGISGNSAYDINIDTSGTFWMGSYWNGLIEFDGDSTFVLYNSSNTNLYPSLEEIISVNVEMDSLIFCGSELGGAASFNKTDTLWTHYLWPNVDIVVNAIEIDKNKNIWYAGIEFVSKMDSNLNWLTYDYDNNYNYDYYHSILEDENGTLLFASNRGLLELDYSNGEEWTKILPPISILDTIGCQGLMRDHNGNIWIGYNNGYLAIYNPNGITSLDNQENTIPFHYSLSQNFPNPFNPTTTINYHIKEDGLVTLKLYDILGKEIKTLVNEDKTKGRYTHNFNGSDLPSGVYIYQLQINDFVSLKKLMLLK